MKTIVIACGTGVVSSALMNAAVEEVLRRNGVQARLVRCRFDQLDRFQEGADLIVTAAALSVTIAKPVVLGTPLLTGRGAAKLERTILNVLASAV